MNLQTSMPKVQESGLPKPRMSHRSRKIANQIPFVTVCLLLVLSRVQNTQLELEKDMQLEIQGPVSKTNLFPAIITPLWGLDPADTRQPQQVPAVLDVSYNYIMMPQKTPGSPDSFGITCQSPSNCDIFGAQPSCIYGSVDVSANCYDASVELQFQDFKDTDANPPMIPFKLFTPSTQDWLDNYGKNGVFGLGPLSPFWAYVNNNFTKQDSQGYIEVSVAYKTQDTTKALNSATVQFADSYLTINGRFGINEPVMQPFSLKSNQSFTAYPVWVFAGAQINYLSGNIDRKGSLCVDNTQNTFFITADAVALKQSVSKQLCGLNTGCVKSNSNVKNVKPIKISFSNSEKSFSMSVSADEFINFDPTSGDAIIGITDIQNTKCAIGSQFLVNDGIGRLFLTKVEFIVRINNDNTLEIGFNEISYPNDSLFLIILIALAAVILVIIIGIMVMSIIDKRKAKAAQSQRQTTDTNQDKYFKAADS